MIASRYNIGNVGKTASMSMLTLFESRYTLKGRYSIGNVGKTASMSMLTLLEFDGYGTVANAKHPWPGYAQSWIQQKQPVEFDGFGTVANAKHPWLGYTQSRI